MTEFLPALIDARYSFHEGPLTQGSCFSEQGLAINCQLFAHILLEELGLALPKWLRSAELYRRSAGRKVWVEKVLPDQQLEKGDIFLFAPRPIRHIQDALVYKLHIAVCVESSSTLLAHSTQYTSYGKENRGGVKIQPICDIQKCQRYNALIGIRRVPH